MLGTIGKSRNMWTFVAGFRNKSANQADYFPHQGASGSQARRVGAGPPLCGDMQRPGNISQVKSRRSRRAQPSPAKASMQASGAAHEFEQLRRTSLCIEVISYAPRAVYNFCCTLRITSL